MRVSGCWTVDHRGYAPCPDPPREFRSLVSIHNHSCHSVEKLAKLNQVVKLTYMRPFSGILQASFGLAAVENLNYAEIHFNPPFTPEDVFDMETAAVRRLGFERASVPVTDHDEVTAGIELRRNRPADAALTTLAEELTVRFQSHVFHLGVTGLPEKDIETTHRDLQILSRGSRFDEMFDLLHATGCLVVLNHPFVAWKGGDAGIPVMDLLTRYGWAIDALEFNGMRRREENDRVLALAERVQKPVVAGGDSHLLVASSVFCGAREAATFQEFIQEVKSGVGRPLVTNDYFAPLNWKLLLRVLSFIGDYRRIGHFRGQPVKEMLRDRKVLLDPVGWTSRVFLRAVSRLGLAR